MSNYKVIKKKSSAEYAKRLLSIKGNWISSEEMEKNRSEINQRVKRF